MSSSSESGDRERWAELKALFNEAVELPPDDWPSLLASVRERDSELADQLESLLNGHIDSLIPDKNPRLEHLLPGATLGPYVVTELIGEGAMGLVYRAKDERLAREVAIKVLPPGLSHDSDRRVRMEREARAMGMLNHPNIVTVYDVGDHNGSPFIVSELLEGQTLREHAGASAAGRLPASEAVEIVASVADALGAAHRRGIVHRDIKPENIFLTRDGRVKVLDFGIAKLVESEAPSDGTVVGTMIGTLGYMTPEQLRGERASAQTDVFACGVVLYELLSGTRPYTGKSQASIIGAILHEPPPPMPGLAPALAAVVARCLEKRTELRFADGAELAMELRALTAFGAITDQGERAAQDRPAKNRASRRPALVALVMVVLASGVIVSLVWRQPHDGTASEPPPSARNSDIVLRAEPSSPVAAVPAAAPPSPSRDIRAAPPGPDDQQRKAAAAPEEPRLANEPGSPLQQPASPPPPALPPPVLPPLNGIWTVSEQITEDVQAIACAASGALQLRLNDGLLDGTLRLKRDCKDEGRRTTDSTEATSALTVGTSTGDAVYFVTRAVDQDLVTTCRYSGQVVGSSKATMAGEVTCEARSAGLSGALTLRGTWRATRTSP